MSAACGACALPFSAERPEVVPERCAGCRHIPPGFVRAWDDNDPNTLHTTTEVTLGGLAPRELAAMVILGAAPPRGVSS